MKKLITPLFILLAGFTALVGAQLGGGGLSGLPLEPAFKRVTARDGSTVTIVSIDNTGGNSSILRLEENDGTRSQFAYIPSLNTTVLQHFSDGAVKAAEFIMSDDGTVDLDTGTLQQGGVNVCLEDGTNCQGALVSEVVDTQTVGCSTEANVTLLFTKIDDQVTIAAEQAAVCTGDATGFNIGLTSGTQIVPSAYRPSGTVYCSIPFYSDNGTNYMDGTAVARINSAGQIALARAGSFTAGWTASGNRNFNSFSCSYDAS